MTTSDHLSATERQALELLPWYVNGTLGAEERELVRRQLLSSLTCRMEFERLRRLQQAMQREDGESAATERTFERLMTRIARSDPAATLRRERSRPLAPWYALASAALVLVTVSGLTWWWLQAESRAPRTYATLTSVEPGVPGAAPLRVVFAPGLSAAARQELLTEYRLMVVAGPTRDDIYTLSPAEDTDERALIAALKADPRIAFTTSPAPTPDR